MFSILKIRIEQMIILLDEIQQLLIVAGFLFGIALMFFFFAYISTQQHDEGSAGKYLAIGLVILVLDVILFLLIVNVFKVYEG